VDEVVAVVDRAGEEDAGGGEPEPVPEHLPGGARPRQIAQAIAGTRSVTRPLAAATITHAMAGTAVPGRHCGRRTRPKPMHTSLTLRFPLDRHEE